MGAELLCVFRTALELRVKSCAQQNAFNTFTAKVLKEYFSATYVLFIYLFIYLFYYLPLNLFSKISVY